MHRERTTVTINVANLIEAIGAAAGIYGVYRLEGLAWALICAAVMLVVAAELIYDGRTATMALPHRPRPAQRAAALWARTHRRRERLRALWIRRTARRTSS